MEWIEALIGFVIIFGCGFGINFFGRWAGKQSQKPIGFWANGNPIDSKSVADIPGYNRAYGKLFRLYAIPFLLSGICILFSSVSDFFTYASLVILLIGGIFGTWWLIRSYQKIEKQYILR